MASAPETFAEAAARLRAERRLRNRRLQQISADLRGGRFESVRTALKEFLARKPDDPDAIMLMAQPALRSEKLMDAQQLLDRCVHVAADYLMARFERAKLLVRMHNFQSALAEIEQLLAKETQNPLFRQLKATVLASIGDDEQALAIFAQLAEENPDRAESWIKYGDALRVTGSREKSIAAYRHAINCRPSFGSAWWSLANLKTFCFNQADIEAIENQLAQPDIASEDRVNLLFALGKAHEDQGAYDRSFEYYAKGNAARRLATEDDAESLSSRVPEKKAVFTRALFESRRGAGANKNDPVFVLGRPRSGSTLIEQILSSHSRIEGTAELPYIADFRVAPDGAGVPRQGIGISGNLPRSRLACAPVPNWRNERFFPFRRSAGSSLRMGGPDTRAIGELVSPDRQSFLRRSPDGSVQAIRDRNAPSYRVWAGHSQIEGTAELADLSLLAKEIQQGAGEQDSTYPAIFAEMDSASLHRLGERYIESTQNRRTLNEGPCRFARRAALCLDWPQTAN
jgi:tetratricopeptide (TPR) repeat protein